MAPGKKEKDALLSLIETVCKNLILSEWDHETCPMRLNQDLALADVERSDLFQTARLMLRFLQEESGTAATEAGFLNRKFVRKLFDAMPLNEERRKLIVKVQKAFNEAELARIHKVRVICELGGLIARRRKRFVLTRSGSSLLLDDAVGKLYRALFISLFRKVDLHYFFTGAQVPAIQQSMAAILWRLDAVAVNWVSVSGLPAKILLPKVAQELRSAIRSPYLDEEWVLWSLVLEHLKDFGLLEVRPGGLFAGCDKKSEIRLTPLWRKFIQFPIQFISVSAGAPELN